MPSKQYKIIWGGVRGYTKEICVVSEIIGLHGSVGFL